MGGAVNGGVVGAAVIGGTEVVVVLGLGVAAEVGVPDLLAAVVEVVGAALGVPEPHAPAPTANTNAAAPPARTQPHRPSPRAVNGTLRGVMPRLCTPGMEEAPSDGTWSWPTGFDSAGATVGAPSLQLYRHFK